MYTVDQYIHCMIEFGILAIAVTVGTYLYLLLKSFINKKRMEYKDG